MDKKLVTIKTLAEKLSVTPSTISKALRDGDDISEKMKVKVKKLANELGYKPNFAARSLVSGKSNMIAVLIPDVATSFFGYILRGINFDARKYGYETVILVSDEDHEEERRQLEFISTLQIDGLIIDTVPGNHNIALLKNISEKGIPIVFIDRKCDQMNADSVTTNDIEAGYSMTRYMISKKRRNIAFIGSVEELPVANDRYKGYSKALKDFQIDIDPSLLLNVGFQIDEDRMKNRIMKFIEKNKSIDAIICAGGVPAYFTGLALIEKGNRIPKEIELGEFGDNNIVHRLGVPFVTVNQNPNLIGEHAFELLQKRINTPRTKEMKRKHTYVKSQLIYNIPAEHKHKIIEEIN